ncbi:MAG: ParB/RepB/Spo0J family partition protein [Leptospiraceae bacterium]|nr:ParB/RepB/Spo0J family partition protein [Leptospiraceae bacterium]MCK6380929.1 ParB/RepB/Spo0J family partition protein [Leptospiraceae bacterium]NUM40015.1 ParB/RepB/Spo0J family partition protein [Leptospiraceae bacterium]
MSKRNDFAAIDLITAYSEKKNAPDKIDISSIVLDQNQPRVFGKNEIDDLVESMRRLGLIEPIIVRKEKSQFIIVAGERRYRSAIQLGWKDIPAIVTEVKEDLCYEISLAENEKRKNLNPWEVGRAIQYLRKEKKRSVKEVSELLGYTERYIKQLSSIARLEQNSVYDLLKSGKEASVKNLESLLKFKEGRGEMISPNKKLSDIIRINLKKLPQKQKETFFRELNALKKKFGLS